MRRSQRQHGYTAVELMMAISIFGIGVAGVIAMEKVTAVSNAHAKNLAMASHIAEAWLDNLSTEATMWNYPATGNTSNNLTSNTLWLRNVDAGQDSAAKWFLPAYSPTLLFGPAFDALGNPVNATVSPGAVAFCSHLRLSWLYQPGSDGNGLIRAEVRVFWLRDGQTFAGSFCAAGTEPNVTGNVTTFHFVQKITAIRENNK
jgi:prepilin-type N-terminal cleavage/methylation domain-containing protein